LLKLKARAIALKVLFLPNSQLFNPILDFSCSLIHSEKDIITMFWLIFRRAP